MIAVQLAVELGEPSQYPAARPATLVMNGIPLFSEFVYDTNVDGERTEEQAARNVLLLFKERLGQLMREDD